jgi:integrase
MKAMKAQTNLVRRGAVYQFRVRVPNDLLKAYRKREIRESLNTRDPEEAKALARERRAEIDREFAMRRAALSGQLAELTAAQIKALADRWVADRLAYDEAARPGRPQRAIDADKEQHWSELMVAQHSAAIGRVDEGPDYEARMFLQRLGIPVPSDPENFKSLVYALVKAEARAAEMVMQRDAGKLVDTPEIPAGIAGGDAVHLDGLMAYWQAQAKPKPKTITEAKSAVRRFKDTNGDLTLREVTKRHALAMRDALVLRKAAPGTIKKLLGLLGSMFQTALEDDEKFGVAVNPIRNVKIRGEVGQSKKRRKPFSAEDIKAIFSSPIYTDSKRPKGGAGEAAYWIPLLGLFTGARLNEIAQLTPHDVRTSEGVWYIHFTNEGEGQSLKQDGESRKRVPIHPRLEKLGFLDYVSRMKAQGDRLFPDLEADSHGHLSGRWSKWFNRYLDDVVKIDDPSKDFHSFRHTFKVYARQAEIPEDQHDALTGHQNASVARTYGNAEGYPLAPLAKAVGKLRFPLPL